MRYRARPAREGEEQKTIVQAVRLTNSIYECLRKEAKDERKSMSELIYDVLVERYSKTCISTFPQNPPEQDDRICYPIDNIPGKPLKISNVVWLRGELITYGELIHQRYKQHKVRIAKGDLHGVPLDKIIKDIEREG